MHRPGLGPGLGLDPIQGREGGEGRLQDQGLYQGPYQGLDHYQDLYQGLYQDRYQGLYQGPGPGQDPGGLAGQNGGNHMIVGVEVAAAEAEAEVHLGLGVIRDREPGRDLRLPGGHPSNKGPITSHDLQVTNSKCIHLHL